MRVGDRLGFGLALDSQKGSWTTPPYISRPPQALYPYSDKFRENFRWFQTSSKTPLKKIAVKNSHHPNKFKIFETSNTPKRHSKNRRKNFDALKPIQDFCVVTKHTHTVKYKYCYYDSPRSSRCCYRSHQSSRCGGSQRRANRTAVAASSQERHTRSRLTAQHSAINKYV